MYIFSYQHVMARTTARFVLSDDRGKERCSLRSVFKELLVA